MCIHLIMTGKETHFNSSININLYCRLDQSVYTMLLEQMVHLLKNLHSYHENMSIWVHYLKMTMWKVYTTLDALSPWLPSRIHHVNM